MSRKRELIHEYLVEGKSARDIAQALDISTSRVRMLLAKVGINIPPDTIRDEVCEAIAWAGFGSFSGFIQQHGLRSLSEQAQELKVSKNGLQRLNELLRQHVEQQATEPGRP